jgi:hypothetical protein
VAESLDRDSRKLYLNTTQKEPSLEKYTANDIVKRIAIEKPIMTISGNRRLPFISLCGLAWKQGPDFIDSAVHLVPFYR